MLIIPMIRNLESCRISFGLIWLLDEFSRILKILDINFCHDFFQIIDLFWLIKSLISEY
jgi:hypothetical protein